MISNPHRLNGHALYDYAIIVAGAAFLIRLDWNANRLLAELVGLGSYVYPLIWLFAWILDVPKE